VTLAEKEEAETTAFLNRVRAEEVQIDKAADKEEGRLTPAQAHQARQATGGNQTAGLANIPGQVCRPAGPGPGKLDNTLLEEEGRGFQAQVAQIHAKYAKLRKEAHAAGADQATQLGSMPMSNPHLQGQEQRVEGDIKKLRGALKELETQKGRNPHLRRADGRGTSGSGRMMGATVAAIQQVNTEAWPGMPRPIPRPSSCATEADIKKLRAALKELEVEKGPGPHLR